MFHHRDGCISVMHKVTIIKDLYISFQSFKLAKCFRVYYWDEKCYRKANYYDWQKFGKVDKCGVFHEKRSGACREGHVSVYRPIYKLKMKQRDKISITELSREHPPRGQLDAEHCYHLQCRK